LKVPDAAAKRHIEKKRRKVGEEISTPNLLRRIFAEYSAIRLAYPTNIWYSVNGRTDYSLQA